MLEFKRVTKSQGLDSPLRHYNFLLSIGYKIIQYPCFLQQILNVLDICRIVSYNVGNES